MNIKKQLEELLFLLEKSSFVNAHDKCEELWRKYKNDENTREESFILKAFVNAFAFFEFNDLETPNKTQYKKIQKLIYKKREEIQI